MFYSCREIDSRGTWSLSPSLYTLKLLCAPCSLRRDASCESPIRPCDTRLFEDIDPGFRVRLPMSVYLFSLAFSRTSPKHRISIKRRIHAEYTQVREIFLARRQTARFAMPFDAKSRRFTFVGREVASFLARSSLPPFFFPEKVFSSVSIRPPASNRCLLSVFLNSG